MPASPSPDADRVVEPDDARTSFDQSDEELDVSELNRVDPLTDPGRPLAEAASRTPEPGGGLSPTRPARPQMLVIPRLPNPVDIWKPGRMVAGRYEVLDVLGEGGMGHVFSAHDLFLRQRVAIKVPHRKIVADPERLSFFREEVALAHAVTHPNVARTFDLGETNDLPYLSMEHLEGETLAARQKRERRMAEPEVRLIARGICAGVEAVHRAGVIHRDLKPANVMLIGPPRRVVVMDFGLATTMGELGQDGSSSDEDAEDSWFVGTPACMAPELWLGERPDHRIDIYAMGVLLYAMLAGRAPFEDRTRQALAVAHIRHAPTPLRELRPEISPGLAQLVHDCLAKNPDDRPKSMAAVALRLREPIALRVAVRTAVASVASGVLLTALAWVLLQFARAAILREMRPAIERLAQLAALQIDPADLDAVRTPEHIETPPFKRVLAVFEKIKKKNPEVFFIYTMRPTTLPDFAFVVDANPYDNDDNGNGKIDDDEVGSPPGLAYEAADYPEMALTIRSGEPQADPDFSSDDWGYFLSGYAPIRRRGESQPAYLVGIDVKDTQLDAYKRAMIGVFGFLWLVATLWAWRFILAHARAEVGE